MFRAYECIHTCICSAANLCLLQGGTLYSNYGNKSNEELILGYGFALPHNEADFFHVMVGLAGTSNPEPGGDYCTLLSSFLSFFLFVTCWQFLELVDCICSVAGSKTASVCFKILCIFLFNDKKGFPKVL